MKKFGLIGHPLDHSFSEKYFADKFEKEQIKDSEYRNYDIRDIKDFESLIRSDQFSGFNITIPYKSDILTFVDDVSTEAEKIGAANTLLIHQGKMLQKHPKTM